MRICKVDTCEGEAGRPGSGRGWCVRHYLRWRRHGDPLGHGPQPIKVCTIEGCDKPHRSRGWCSKHWTRWSRYGTPTARMPGEVVDGKKVCPTCGEDKPLDDYSSRRQSYCRPCVRDRMRAKRAVRPDPPRPKTNKACAVCGTTFLGDKRNSLFCSTPCRTEGKARWDKEYQELFSCPEETRARGKRWREKYPERVWAKSVAYRARKKDAFVEDVDRNIVYERDGWVCQLCTFPIDPAFRWPHPLSPSVDHRIPLCLGGEHSYANCQAAHLECNVRKGATAPK